MARKAGCRVAAVLAAGLSGALGLPVHAETEVSPAIYAAIYTCRDDCEAKRRDDEAKCRKIPKKETKRREACWRKANDDYAKCVKDCPDD
jgi:hypothetical protein